VLNCSQVENIRGELYSETQRTILFHIFTKCLFLFTCFRDAQSVKNQGIKLSLFFWKVSQIFGNFNCVGVILWPSSSGRVSNFGLLIVRVSNFDLFQKGGSQILGLFKREGIKCWPFSSGRLLNFKLFEEGGSQILAFLIEGSQILAFLRLLRIPS
jgi:hypothetical protein